MTVIDANLLLYAHNADSPRQRIVAQWLVKLLKTGEIIAFRG